MKHAGESHHDLHQKRMAMLEEELKANPTDPFNHYALALEMEVSNPSSSLDRLSKIVEQFPDYVPAYYQTARMLIGVGRESEAVVILQKGIQEALKQRETKPAAEMKSLLEELTF